MGASQSKLNSLTAEQVADYVGKLGDGRVYAKCAGAVLAFGVDGKALASIKRDEDFNNYLTELEITGLRQQKLLSEWQAAKQQGYATKKPRYTARRYTKGVDRNDPSTLPRNRLVELVLKLASEKELVVLKGPAACGKSSLMNLTEHYCNVNETAPDGNPTPATFYTYMETSGKNPREQIMDAVTKLNLEAPWKNGDPFRILLLDDIHNVGDRGFWLKLINEGFAWKQGVSMVGALTYVHVKSPRFSPLLQKDSTICFAQLRLTKDEEDQLLPMIMNEKTNLNRLDEASKTAIVNAVTDQCQGHIFAIMVSLDKLDDFAALPQHHDDGLISYFLSKQFLDHAYTRIWPEGTDDFAEDAIKELQDAMIDDQKGISVAVQSLLQKVYFVLPPTQPTEARTWPQIKQEITFKLSARRLYSSLFPTRSPDESSAKSIQELVEHALKSFHRVDLIQSCGASEGNFPKEGALQQMFYFGLVSSLPASTEVVVEMSAILPPRGDRKKGELDFYVNSKFFYLIELMWHGNNFKEHRERFSPGAKYYTPAIAKYRIVDFRPCGFRATNKDPYRLVIEFHEDYKGCTMWSKGNEVSSLSFLL